MLYTIFFSIFLFLPINAFAENTVVGGIEIYNLLLTSPFLIIGLLLFSFSRERFSNPPEQEMGFELITPGKKSSFYALKEEDTSMKNIADSLADDSTNIYSNLNKITLSVKTNSVLLEDKNFKNSILINRRRNRRTILNDGDILDMGELTLMFINPHKKTRKNHPSNIKHSIKPPTKLLPKIASLVPVDGRKKTVYLSKNITFIGRSEINDIVTKVRAVSMHHAKIERVAGRHKIVDFGSENGTYVNGRRIEEYYLREGDEISFESLKYKFTSKGSR